MAADTVSTQSKEMQLSWEPVKTVLSPSCCTDDGFHNFATLELSNPDLLYHDGYNSILLIYDSQRAAETSSLKKGVTASAPRRDETVRQLVCALEELLVHYPSAAGLLVHNESNGRLEVRYLLPAYSSSGQYLHARTSDRPQHSTAFGPCGDDIDAHSSASMFGVQFHVAHADLSLSDLGDVSDPQPCMDVLYPVMKHPTCGRCIMAFQLTTFKCGGFTLAHTCSHIYGDGFTGATFVQNLCSIARGAGVANPPDFSTSRREAVSPREPPSPTVQYMGLGTRERDAEPPQARPPKHLHSGTAKRFVFSMDALETLRVHTSTTLKPCSRTQALMALLWTAFATVKLHVHRLPGSAEMPLRLPMNLRSRSGIPNLTPSYVGNAIYAGSACATLQELCESPLSHVVDKIRSVVTGSLDLVEAYQSLLDELELKHRAKLVPVLQGGLLTINSLVSLPFYDTDCGWGPPIYVGFPSQQPSKRCIILNHPTARAWNVLAVFASEEECTCFETVLANYICPNKKE